ncbi:carbohydrate binding family 9 domain-containing protein, partial [Candidatus Poribacteria bacterium]|nr:carbohydrate binding family 9 domain-containing protein [Candidatus Poribacteria bacterium]
MQPQKTCAIVLRITLSLISIINLQTVAAQNPQTVKKELPAVKTEQPPTIDGILNDACWQDAPQATGFTDERTEKSAKNQSVGRLVYTDEAIYVGLHLYDDMSDKIVARQVKDQTRISGEDWVSFSLDPFHTHQFSDRNFFIVNPLGTKFAHLATGRAEKSEWIGLWKTAAQIVEDGWIVEMEIPWQMLDYPDTTQPVRMGINVDRFQQRTGERS